MLLKTALALLASLEPDLLMQEVNKRTTCCAVPGSRLLASYGMSCLGTQHAAKLGFPCLQGFEELLTSLKVTPVQWSSQRLRAVLNAAVASPLTPQVLPGWGWQR